MGEVFKPYSSFNQYFLVGDPNFEKCLVEEPIRSVNCLTEIYGSTFINFGQIKNDYR